MKIVHMVSSCYVPSVEEAARLVNSSRGQVKILVRNLTRFNAEVATPAYLSSFDHVPARFNNHLETVDKLYGKEAYLTQLENNIRRDFAGVPAAEALLKRIDSLRSYARKNLEKSMGKMVDCCVKFQPAYYSLTLDYADKVLDSFVKKGLIAGVSGRFQLARAVSVKPTRYFKKTQASQFVSYYLVTMADGSEKCLAVSCLVDPYGRFKMGVSALPVVTVPGRFKSAVTLADHVSCKKCFLRLLGLEG